nr:protein piccolo-like [Pelodiscus sinensis]|eukprot:XP_025043908.1 protein piccolo-like [Pelodiscus sinensis]
MNTKKNLIGLSFKSNSEKRDTFLRRSGVPTPARGTSQPSQMVVLQLSRGKSQPSRMVALQLFRGMSQPSQVTLQEPSRVTTSKQRSQKTSQFSRVTVQKPSLVVALQPTRVTVPQPTRVTVPEATSVTGPQPCQGMALQPFQGALQFSWVVVSQPSHGTSQPACVMVPQLSLGTSQLARVVVPLPSRGMSQPSHVSASLAPPPAPPAPTPTHPAQPYCRRLSLQQGCSPVHEGISSPEKDQFRQPRAKLDAELAGEAEGSRGTTMPLALIQPLAAAATGPAAIYEQPKKEQPRKSSPTLNRGRSIRNPGKAVRPEPEAAVPTTKYRIKLSANATWLLLRHHQNEWGWMNPFIGTGLLPGSQSRAGVDLTSFMKISLLNDQNRYDDE